MKRCPRQPVRRVARDRRRRGSVYVLVLSVSMLITSIGLSAIAVVRVQRTAVESDQDISEARWLAEAAVQHAVHKLALDADWRNTYTHNQWVGPLSFGGGTFGWKLLDEADSDLSDDVRDKVLIVAWGRAGRAIQKVTVEAHGKPQLMQALGYAVASEGQINIALLRKLKVSLAKASSNGSFSLLGTFEGDAEGSSLGLLGLLIGNATVAPAKAMPQPDLFDTYVNRATALPFTGDISHKVIAPKVNEYGSGLNDDGVYYINTGGADLRITRARIFGTLVIDTQGGRVTIDEQASLTPYRGDYPALIIRGNLTARQRSATVPTMDEATVGHNFNPPGAPYGLDTDYDQSDSYPNLITGLVHVIGDARLELTQHITGSLLVEGDTTAAGDNLVTHDAQLVGSRQPAGYIEYGAGVSLDNSTWRWQTN